MHKLHRQVKVIAHACWLAPAYMRKVTQVTFTLLEITVILGLEFTAIKFIELAVGTAVLLLVATTE